MPFKREKYPKNWEEFSKQIRFERAKNRCEKCDVPNYAIIFRHDEEWDFWEMDEQGYSDRLTIRGDNGFADSKELLQFILEIEDEPFDDEDNPRPSLIVLTVAHLDQIGDVCDCEEKTGNKCAVESHVLALCQRCHLIYDKERHKFNRRRSRAEEMNQQWFLDWDQRFEATK